MSDCLVKCDCRVISEPMVKADYGIEKILTNTDNALKELVDADKALNAEPIDPFAGLSTENYTVTLKSKNDYEKVLEFMKREGIDYE